MTTPRTQKTPRPDHGGPAAPSRRTVLGAAGAAIAAGGLAACTSGGPDNDIVGDADYEPGSADLKVQLGKEIEGVQYPEDYKGPRHRELEPFGDGTSFSVLTRTVPEVDYSTNYYSKLLQEKTGVPIEYSALPEGEDGVTKVNAIISGGDLPDAMLTGGGLFTLSQVSVYGEQGLFIPLDKLIDENAPHVVDMFSTFPDMRKLFTSPDGRMYALPSMRDCYHCKSASYRTWYNDDWLQATGGTVPQTLDELDALLTEFSGLSSRPENSVNTAVDSSAVVGFLYFFLSSFVQTTRDSIINLDGKLSWVPSLDGFRDGMIWVQQQFAKGNFDKAVFSLKGEQFTKMGDDPKGPRFGIINAVSPFDFATNIPQVVSDPRSPASIMKVLPPLEGPGGVRTTDWEHYAIGDSAFVISRTCKDPVTMIRWADYQYELALTNSVRFGAQDKGWTFSKAGAKGIDGQQAVWSASGDVEKNQAWLEFGPVYKSLSQRNGQEVPAEGTSIEAMLYEAGKAYEPYAIPKENKVPTLAFDMEGASQIGEYKSNLNTALLQGLANFGTGRADATKDADWKAFQDSFTNQGVAQYLEVNQKAFDEQS